MSGNRWNGINANIARIQGNFIFNNGNGGGLLYTAGININSGTILGNTIMGNAGYGFIAGSAVGFGNNTLSSNLGGTHSGGVELQANVCNGIPCGNT